MTHTQRGFILGILVTGVVLAVLTMVQLLPTASVLFEGEAPEESPEAQEVPLVTVAEFTLPAGTLEARDIEQSVKLTGESKVQFRNGRMSSSDGNLGSSNDIMYTTDAGDIRLSIRRVREESIAQEQFAIVIWFHDSEATYTVNMRATEDGTPTNIAFVTDNLIRMEDLEANTLISSNRLVESGRHDGNLYGRSVITARRGDTIVRTEAEPIDPSNTSISVTIDDDIIVHVTGYNRSATTKIVGNGEFVAKVDGTGITVTRAGALDHVSPFTLIPD